MDIEVEVELGPRPIQSPTKIVVTVGSIGCQNIEPSVELINGSFNYKKFRIS